MLPFLYWEDIEWRERTEGDGGKEGEEREKKEGRVEERRVTARERQREGGREEEVRGREGEVRGRERKRGRTEGYRVEREIEGEKVKLGTCKRNTCTPTE